MPALWSIWQSKESSHGHAVYFPQFTKYASIFSEGIEFIKALPNIV